MQLADVLQVYAGSDGQATRAMYDALDSLGPLGSIAVNLFRAQKCSERAKVYRGGGYRGAAYDRKQWSMNNLVGALTEHDAKLGLVWGWGIDEKQEYHRHVLYVELPGCGQVSFHTDRRGAGPDYAPGWDGARDASPGRICRFVAQVFAQGVGSVPQCA